MPKPVSEELPNSISNVRPDPKLEKRRYRDFAFDSKLQIIAQADACVQGEP